MRNTSGVRTSKLGLSKILIGFVFILYCLGRCRRKTGIPDPEVRVLGGQNDLTREIFFSPNFLFVGWRQSHFLHMSTRKDQESYGRIIPPVLELWYTRDIVLDLILTSHKYPLVPGNQDLRNILLSLWRTFHRYH